MKRKILSLIAAAAIYIPAASIVQAEEITIQKGDTLWDLSRKYGVSIDSLKQWNSLSDDLIYAYDSLEVSPSENFLVEKGDTLWDISRSYGVTVRDLKNWNDLESNLIHPNLDLTVYTSEKDAIETKTDNDNKKDISEDFKSERMEEEIKTDLKTNEVTKKNPETEEIIEVQEENVKVEKNKAVKEVVKQELPERKENIEEKTETVSAEPKKVEPSGKELTVTATAYTAECKGCIGITKTGVNLKENPDAKVIAVDPSVIPLGSKVHVEGYGYATAEDIGGAIKGNKIDVFIPEQDDALEWGRKEVKLTIVE
ncbi:3D (Asp-Asp-Asp) domain-containing protein [Mesobacillus persicus]|uniref:3D (Asp-Asp-Asp) domain-containing protein n=1 Tax=Mesobacillus persicus TaxID=930146 RepID=A0A1H7Z3Z8_9BACI|nr:LysM peptidoglycan-binding domain-containing protein [Mesobacillus persicus]SEM52288.1 3D (Asp-Asp-Asp) domain-containing protein [Mesobacillus persicus]